MLTFKINEIAQGESSERVELPAGSVDCSPFPFLGGVCDVRFQRKADRIRAMVSIQANLELICDRCLEPFSYALTTQYEIVFDPATKEELEDENSAVRMLNIPKNQISILNEVRDTIVLAVPLKKIHPRFAVNEDNSQEIEQIYADPDLVDPRWDVLKNLMNQKN